MEMEKAWVPPANSRPHIHSRTALYLSRLRGVPNCPMAIREQRNTHRSLHRRISDREIGAIRQALEQRSPQSRLGHAVLVHPFKTLLLDSFAHPLCYVA